MNDKNENTYIITGTMGSGKSTVIQELIHQGVATITEPARDILYEQRLINGNGIPEKDPQLFTNLLLSRAIFQYRVLEQANLVISDRGVPDVIAYAKLFNLDLSIYINAANKFRYNQKVFILPCWPEIYENDDERKMTLNQAQAFSTDLYEIYESVGYQLVEVPRLTPEQRASFILDNI